MAHRWVFGIVFNLVILLNKDYGNRYEEESIAQETSFSSTGLALAQNWQGGTWCEEVAGDFSYAAFPSLQRHRFSLSDRASNGYLYGIRLALWQLPQNEIAECMVLRLVRWLLGRLCSPNCKSEQCWMGVTQVTTWWTSTVVRARLAMAPAALDTVARCTGATTQSAHSSGRVWSGQEDQTWQESQAFSPRAAWSDCLCWPAPTAASYHASSWFWDSFATACVATDAGD